VSHTYCVQSAIYDGTAPGNDNPLVTLEYSVDGTRSFIGNAVFWKAIQFANAADGQAAVRSYLAPVLLGAYLALTLGKAGAPFPQPPDFPKTANIPTPSSGPDEVCNEALVGTWTQ
jgi:hypothetical protein